MNIWIIMPAYNMADALPKVVNKISPHYQNIMVVDDHSTDKTVEVAKMLNLQVLVHGNNQGYGAVQKTGYKAALEAGADIVAMLHGDGQYDPKYLDALINKLQSSEASAVIGSRMYSYQAAYRGGMPWWKLLSNVVLTKLANLVLKTKIRDWHSGYRVYKVSALKSVAYEKFSDGFEFDIDMAKALISCGFSFAEIPISTIYNEDSSSISFFRSVKYGILFIYKLFR